MSQSEPDAPSTDAPGKPFTSETASESAEKVWQTRREEVLKDHGLWETWKCVPPLDDREKPVEAYLPGGEEYDDE